MPEEVSFPRHIKTLFKRPACMPAKILLLKWVYIGRHYMGKEEPHWSLRKRICVSILPNAE